MQLFFKLRDPLEPILKLIISLFKTPMFSLIGPDVINKFTLILLNKNPKIYDSIIRMGDWS